jgi:hypothetical protein
LSVKRFQSQLRFDEDSDNEDLETNGSTGGQVPRVARQTHVKLCRYQMIKFNYVVHYAFYSLIIGHMIYFGAFEKNGPHYQDPHMDSMNE